MQVVIGGKSYPVPEEVAELILLISLERDALAHSALLAAAQVSDLVN